MKGHLRQLAVNTRRLYFLYNNLYFYFTLFCTILSTLLLPSAVPDRDAYGYLALLVKELKMAFSTS